MMRFNLQQTSLIVFSAAMLATSPAFAQHFDHHHFDHPAPPPPMPVQTPTPPPQIPTAPAHVPNLEEMKQRIHDEAAAIRKGKKEIKEKEDKIAKDDKKYRESLEAELPALEEKLNEAEAAHKITIKKMMKACNAFQDYVEKARSGAFGPFSSYDKGSLPYTSNAIRHTNQELKTTYSKITEAERLIKKMTERLKTARTDSEREYINNAIQSHIATKEALIIKAEGLEEHKAFLLTELTRIQSILDEFDALHQVAEAAWQKNFKAEKKYKEARTALAITHKKMRDGRNRDAKIALAKEKNELYERHDKMKAETVKLHQAYVESRKAAKQKALTQKQEQMKLAEQKRLQFLQKRKSWPTESEAKKTALHDIDPDTESFKPEIAGDTHTFQDPNYTPQEVREQIQKDAFRDLAWADASYKVVRTVDVTGQVAQTAIGFIPGMSGADTALAASRGFAESIGKSYADGVDPIQAIKAAALNAGYTGAISFVGNKLTGGADKHANRVIVLTQVGFSKLKTKQIAEMGAKGITFAVIKTTQVIGSAAVDSAGRKVAKKVDKAIDKSIKNAASGPSSYAGHGTSIASRPFVQY